MTYKRARDRWLRGDYDKREFKKPIKKDETLDKYGVEIDDKDR